MGTSVAADATIDYAIFRILPENRYDACVCNGEKEEMVGHGPLDQLLEHVPSIKDQISKGSCDNFKLELPNAIVHSAWFTKATLMRFLHIIGSSDLKKCIALSCEMSQLEEARKFHLSLYTKAEGITSTDTSKNELLWAMNSRLAALTKELLSAYTLAVGATTVSFQEISDLQKFCLHFGDVNVRNLFTKLLEKSQKGQTVGNLDKPKMPRPHVSKDDYVNKSGGSILVSAQSDAVKPVKYSASPAKAAELERQSSSESEDSSFSSEDDQPPVERCRTLIRSASPRRSASPMRKIQIGRSGPRRTPALAVRSLPHYPSRDRVSSIRDCEDDGDSEGPEELVKKTEVNVTRLSVQDAISMFEKKQKDDIVESQKKALNDSSLNSSKPVLRRWSSGMGESQKSMTQSTPENTFLENKAYSLEEDIVKQPESKPDTDSVLELPESEDIVKADMESERRQSETGLSMDEVPTVCQTGMVNDKLDSAEWSRQKEEELNQMLMKFAQYNLSNPKNFELDNDKNNKSLSHHRGGLNGHQRGSNEEKPNRENSVKKSEKKAELRPKRKVLEKAKTGKSPAKISDVGRNLSTCSASTGNTTSRTLNVNKNSSMPSNLRKESPKPGVLKRAPPKSSRIPATRKSWPLTSLPRASETAAAKKSQVPPSATSVGPRKPLSPTPCHKPQVPASVSRQSPRVERSEVQQKVISKPQVDAKKNLRKEDAGKSQIPSKSGNTRTITRVVPEGKDAVNPVITTVHRKVTKKSSVVPLEAKPSSRKVSGINSGSSPNVKKREIPSQAEQCLRQCDDPVKIPENVGTAVPETVHPSEEVQESESWSNRLVLEMELEREPDNGQEQVISFERQLELPAGIQSALEPVISPAAWEESSPLDQPIPVVNSSSHSPVNHDMVASSGTRVRHSLSQMLFEESSEPDTIEWGNAEHPPAVIFQKDAPKGLKRLLKFARKNKGESNGTAWASPYTSEGEDEGDEHKSLGKRHSDNLLKVALHSKNYVEGFLSDSEPHSARSNVSNISTRSSSKFQDGHTSKGSRSFFSLSAFRNKS